MNIIIIIVLPNTHIICIMPIYYTIVHIIIINIYIYSINISITLILPTKKL